MKKCENCGNEIADEAQFCAKCGSAQGAAGDDATQAMPATGGQQAQPTQAMPATGAGQAAPATSTANYKDAKAAYKQARKDAGKSNKPVIVLVIMGIIVVAAAAVAATLFFTGQNQPEPAAQVEEVVATEPEPEPASSDVGASESSSASEEAVLSATTGADDGPYASYVGTWKGQMVSTEGGGYKRCYGAEGQEMVLTISSISATGHMKASIELLYHGHSAIERSDVDSSSGDKRVSFPDLTGTFDTEGFEFSIPVGSGDDNRVEIEVEEDGSALIATVTSYYQDDRTETDTYELVKAR